MLISKKQKLLGRVVVLFLLCATVVLFWPQQCLTARSGGKLLFAWPIGKGESFEVSFIHSLNLSPITDVIEWTGSDLVVRKSIFHTFGAGVPVLSDGIGTQLLFVDGRYELIGIDKHMQSFTVITQELPNHSIVFNERSVFLLEAAETGKAVDVEVERVFFVVRLMCRG